VGRFARPLLVALLLTLEAGCSLIPGGVAAAPEGAWRLVDGTADGRALPVVAGSEPTLTISGGEASGRAGCNLYGGTISIDGDRVRFSALQMTEMACDEPRMSSEAAYLAALAEVATASRSGDRLVLGGETVELRFELVPPQPDQSLVGVNWVLESLVDGEVAASVAGEPATLRIEEDGHVSGSTGCRGFTARASVDGARMVVSELVTDDRACAAELVGQDEHVLAVLDGEVMVSISGDQLSLTGRDRLGLDYRAAEPPGSSSSSG
jgi:heat shock protein HslJ